MVEAAPGGSSSRRGARATTPAQSEGLFGGCRNRLRSPGSHQTAALRRLPVNRPPAQRGCCCARFRRVRAIKAGERPVCRSDALVYSSLAASPEYKPAPAQLPPPQCPPVRTRNAEDRGSVTGVSGRGCGSAGVRPCKRGHREGVMSLSAVMMSSAGNDVIIGPCLGSTSMVAGGGAAGPRCCRQRPSVCSDTSNEGGPSTVRSGAGAGPGVTRGGTGGTQLCGEG